MDEFGGTRQVQIVCPKCGGNTGNVYRCPVCHDEFQYVAEADRHYDRHKPSDYITTWEVSGDDA